MKPFNVYALYPITLVRGQGSTLIDQQGQAYLDFYGGHAVISIGHNHPHFIRRVSAQLHELSFYSNAVINPLQIELADKLGKLSGYETYSLFLCNSGAEAIENALKIAAFHTGKRKVIYFEHSFHGRTAAAVELTDNPSIRTSMNDQTHRIRVTFNDRATFGAALQTNDVAAVIIEGIQGVGGIQIPDDAFLKHVWEQCKAAGVPLILDEIQSGYGRTGRFFAHQYAGITPDLITVAKGMGNGFPVAGVLIAPHFEAKIGSLGTTFGGAHLACAAALAVIETIEAEQLIPHAEQLGKAILSELKTIPGLVEVRGRGLMIGITLPEPIKTVRDRLLYEHRIFVGTAHDPNILRLLPPLNITQQEAERFIQAFRTVYTG